MDVFEGTKIELSGSEFLKFKEICGKIQLLNHYFASERGDTLAEEGVEHVPSAIAALSSILTELHEDSYLLMSEKENELKRNRGLVTMVVDDDTMEPTISRGETVKVDLNDRMIAEGVFLLDWGKGQTKVARLQPSFDESGVILVCHDNSHYKDIKYSREEIEQAIVGQVVSVQKRFVRDKRRVSPNTIAS